MHEEPDLPAEAGRIYLFGPFRLDVGEHRLTCNGAPVALGHKAFDILRILVESGGSLRTRDELIDLLWPKLVVQEQNLTTNIYKLRRALGDEGETPLYIETVRGLGYRFIAKIQIEPVAATGADADGPAGAGTKRRARLVSALASLILLAALAAWLHWRISERGSISAPSPTVAVLPFENLGKNGHDAFLAEGIQDTILTRLATLRGIHVISRTSADAYSSHPQNLRKIAGELKASAVLEGSVQEAKGRVLINVQLIDAGSDTHLWAATYARPLDNIFDVEGDVAKRVATALLTKLDPEEAKALTEPPTMNTRAYVALLRANHVTDRLFDWTDVAKQDAAVREAVSLYRKAISLDPNFALAYARLSILESRAYWFNLGGQRTERIADAEEDANNALALAPGLAEAYVASGFVAYYRYADYKGALARFRHAHDLLPHDAEITGAMAFVERRMGLWQPALDDLKEAERIDPRNPHWSRARADTLVALRRYREAVDEYDLALAVDPANYQALIRKADVMLMTGQLDGLASLLARIPADVDPEGVVSILRFDGDMLRHRYDKALDDIAQAPEWVTGIETIPHFPRDILAAEAWLLKGDRAQARRYFMRARKQLIESSVDVEPRNYGFWAALGLAEAGLGDREKGIADGKRAIERFPLAADAMRAPYNQMNMAQIDVLAGKPQAALKILASLLAVPAGTAICIGRIERDPLWRSVRALPAYGALLARYGKAAAPPIAMSE